MQDNRSNKENEGCNVRVLVLYNRLWHYRIPIFNLLADKVKLDVAFVDGEKSSESKFGQIKLDSWNLGGLVVIKQNVLKLAQNYDVVIALGHIAWLNYALLPFYPSRKFKLIFWSIGVSASYTKRYDEVTRYDFIRDFFYRRAEALIFYSEYPLDKYKRRGFDLKKIFVANNTVEIKRNCFDTKKPRNSILFIGTLYPQKGIFNIVREFKETIVGYNNELHLEVVGDGPDFEALKEYIRINKLSKRITLHGAVYDEESKSKIFDRSLLVISPYQAGLGVLESFGNRLPFVTFNNSFTGGERFNISHGETGLIYDSAKTTLQDIMSDILQGRYNYLEMGINALNWYSANRRPDQMAKSIYEAITSVIER